MKELMEVMKKLMEPAELHSANRIGGRQGEFDSRIQEQISRGIGAGEMDFDDEGFNSAQGDGSWALEKTRQEKI